MYKNDTLKDQTILITGGGSGLGLSMAKKMASVGADIAICGRTENKLKDAVKEIEENGVGKVHYYVTDVRDYDSVSEMVRAIVDDFGSLDGLVNNAAGNFLSASEDLTPNAFRTIVDIVLQGTFNCTHCAGNYWIDSDRKGNVLNIVTTYTESGSAFVLPSASAKAGVLALTNTLAYEWATYGIRLNSIAPGPFPTKGAWTRLLPDPKMEDMYKRQIPMGRYGDHEELANTAVFLMSDLAPYITGSCITIDGGEHLKSGQFNFIDQLMPRDQLKQLFNSLKPKK